MVIQIFNVQRLSDGKTYQNGGSWGTGNNYPFPSESDAVTSIDTQDNRTYRINSLYNKS